MNDKSLCWEILPKVSRSFSLCIRVLPSPLDDQMMVSYLAYRVIDTIEDSDAPLEAKKGLFAKFMSLLSRRKANSRAAEECGAELLSRLNYTYEKDLLSNLPALVRTYYSLPAGARAPIRKWGRTMANGMYEFQKKPIETFADQDRYSYYVAGVIGHLFNDLLHFNAIISLHLKRVLSRYAKSFGLALQKVNILRDIAEDVTAHRYYWPKNLLAKYGLDYSTICSKENRKRALAVLREQIDDARQYINAAMKYILLLPKNALRVRMFCLIPLFMAIQSYVKCMDNTEVFEAGKKVKISREQVQEIVAKSGLYGTNNERLVTWFVDAMGSDGAVAVADFAIYKSR